MERTRLLIDEDTGPEWVVTYHLGDEEVDDSFEDASTKEVIFNALDFDHAAMYAQQYLRKMQIDDATSETWANAEILSVELH